MESLDEPLYWACRDRAWSLAATLLEAGAGTEWRDGVIEDTAIMWAAPRGSLATATLLFNRGANIHALGNNGWNALMNASYRNYADVVSFLADKGLKGTDIHVRNSNGQDALLIAAVWGNIDVALELIARQADARVVDQRNRAALTHFGSPTSDLSASERQQGQTRLIAAWLAGPHPSQVAERHWQRRKNGRVRWGALVEAGRRHGSTRKGR